MRKEDTERIEERIARKDFPIHEQFADGIGCNLERALPYLIVCRKAGENERALIANESSYIWAEEGADADELICKVSRALSDVFGALALVEFWIEDGFSKQFGLRYTKEAIPAVIKTLEKGFSRPIGGIGGITVDHGLHGALSPAGCNELFAEEERERCGILKLAIEVPRFFSDPASGAAYPVFFRRFKRRFSNTVKKGVYAFIRVQTSVGLPSYQMLGRKHLNKAVWKVDRALAEIEQAFEFLLLVAPSNARQAWEAFLQSSFDRNPIFHYPLLPVDPERLKRQLYQIDIDAVDDPSVAYIFREKREELDTLITMLNERDSRNFLFSSIRLFKLVDEPLLNTAREILALKPAEDSGRSEYVDARGFAESAEEEFKYYREQYPEFSSSVEIRKDVIGLMVSKGRLLVGSGLKVPAARVNALLHHEVGTHVLTYCNGAAQPLAQLKEGLAGYDELQEGIAVLAEYLVGGLSLGRLRVLAARVVAAEMLVKGEDFKGVFHFLVEEQGFAHGVAFELVTRIFQSGGLTKDIIYLRGLIRLMDYLKNDGALEPLFIGKIAEKHIPIIKELQEREVLGPLPTLPRYLKEEEGLRRLQRVREGLSLTQLVETEIK